MDRKARSRHVIPEYTYAVLNVCRNPSVSILTSALSNLHDQQSVFQEWQTTGGYSEVKEASLMPLAKRSAR